MKNVQKAVFVMAVLISFSLIGCASTQNVNNQNGKRSMSHLLEKNVVKCGNVTHNIKWWPEGARFAYETMDRGNWYKWKLLEKVASDTYVHLGCNKFSSPAEAQNWMYQQNIQFTSRGEEPGGASGLHKTVDHGPIYSIPAGF